MAKKLKITVEGHEYIVTVEELGGSISSFGIAKPSLASPQVKPVTALPSNPPPPPAIQAPKKKAAPPSASDVKAPMTGVLVEFLVKVGDAIKAGQQVATLEAMKMKTAIMAPADGTVVSLNVEPGGTVDADQAIISVSSGASSSSSSESAASAKSGVTPAPAGGKGVEAPMTGVLVEFLVKAGDDVAVGQQVATLEAMKMKTAIMSQHAGKVLGLHAEAGSPVDAGQIIVSIG